MDTEKPVGNVPISAEYVSDRAIVKLAVATLASDRDAIQKALTEWIVATYLTRDDGADKESKSLKRKLHKTAPKTAPRTT